MSALRRRLAAAEKTRRDLAQDGQPAATVADAERRVEAMWEQAEDALGAVAASHDHNCAPELRHQAREALGLGRCEPRQDCPFCPAAPVVAPE